MENDLRCLIPYQTACSASCLSTVLEWEILRDKHDTRAKVRSPDLARKDSQLLLLWQFSLCPILLILTVFGLFLSTLGRLLVPYFQEGECWNERFRGTNTTQGPRRAVPIWHVKIRSFCCFGSFLSARFYWFLLYLDSFYLHLVDTIVPYFEPLCI